MVFLHVQALLGLGGFILGAVAYHSVAMWQVEVECDERAVLHAQGPQGRAVNLRKKCTKTHTQGIKRDIVMQLIINSNIFICPHGVIYLYKHISI